VDATTKRAEELGASVLHRPADVGAFGRCSVFVDPSGVTIAVYQQKAGC